MAPEVNTDDLVDAHAVAEMLGLSHPNSVSTYLRRYEDFPAPIVDLGRGRPRLWLRPQITNWAASRRRGTSAKA